ncbi:MAG TPA: NAD-dependent epimerase/dehydratase family protein [Actinomycetota bacterium]|nr:NAD-dependent epimerase/dehydratase family protein [Actinomycetota bacterium]
MFGGSGFVGGIVSAAVVEAGHHLTRLTGVRVEGAYHPDRSIEQSALDWIRSHPDPAAQLTRELSGVDVLVNAAGMAEPESDEVERLFDSNAVLAAVVAQTAAGAGVPRLIHISSAAVQGRRDPLDETDELEPLTAYGRSKAAGERVLLQRKVDVPAELVVYRPTSVQGPSRGLTRKLVAFTSLPLVPLPGRGTSPVPVCLGPAVGAVVVFLLSAQSPPAVVLQPSDGMTTRTLLDALGDNPRYLPVPGVLAKMAVEAGYRLGRRSSRIGALSRRLDLLVNGQAQDARALRSMGFTVAADLQAYRRLGAQVRAESRPAPPD